MSAMRFSSKRIATRLLLALTGVSAACAPRAHAQEWIIQFGTSAGDEATAVAPDGVGGVMIAGTTGGSLFPPRAGQYDAFLARYNEVGTLQWPKQFGTSWMDGAHALAPDGAGGVLVAGETWGSLFGTNAGWSDVFLARYTIGGSLDWARQFGTSSDDIAYAVALDAAGGVVVAGYTRGDLAGSNAGGRDVFLARYTIGGSLDWIRQFGTSADEMAFALAPYGASGVMVAGATDGRLGATSAGQRDAFLAPYDHLGTPQPIIQFGTFAWDEATALAPDGAGGVLVAGVTLGDLAGSHGEGDAFLARYNSAGDRDWIRQFGTSAGDGATAVANSGAGNVAVAGSTQGSLGGPHRGGQDVFLAHYNLLGNQFGASQFGTPSQDVALALAPDGTGGVMVAGRTEGSLAGPNLGSSDVFLARFAEVCEGDLDGDGDTDLADLGILLGDFGCPEPGNPTPCEGDLDGDDDTDLADLGILLGDFGCGS